MVLAGDEFGRTQQGNNNAYCQDNEISWVDWDHDERGEALIRFVERLTALRRRTRCCGRAGFLTASVERGTRGQGLDLADPGRRRDDAPSIGRIRNARCLGLLLDGRAQASGIPRRGSEATLLLIVNAHHDVVVFKLPEVTGGRDWVRLIDTNLPEEDDDPEEPTRFAFGHHYEVTGRSLLLFLARPARAVRPTQARAPGAAATPAAE